jgi:Rad3-related DNA helicase
MIFVVQLLICLNQSENVDIILTPYNYVIDRSASIGLTNKVLIFDEGHHLEQRLEERNSFAITTSTLRKAYDEIEVCTMQPEVSVKELKKSGKRLRDVMEGKNFSDQWLVTTQIILISSGQNENEDGAKGEPNEWQKL